MTIDYVNSWRQQMSDSTLFQLPEPKPGRPQVIPDSSLLAQFEHLLFFFEHHWAEVAWDLDRAHSMRAIRSALQRANVNSYRELEPFLYEPTRKVEHRKLRLMRESLGRLRGRASEVIKEKQELGMKLERIALVAKDNPADERIRLVFDQIRQDHSKLAEQLTELQTRQEEVSRELREGEAYFAQTQLLDFIRSERYTLTPFSYAKAMAGMPYVTWRQSAVRCAKLIPKYSPGVEYRKFRIVFKALGKPPRTAMEATRRVKAFLLRQSRRDLAIEKLRQEWYYLHTSIETIYSQKTPRKALAYQILAEYCRRLTSRSDIDLLMEGEEHL